LLESHRLDNLRTAGIRERLELAQRRRLGLVARLLPARRDYLEGLIHGLRRELERRRGPIHDSALGRSTPATNDQAGVPGRA
jgi:hypothetical protein